MKGTIETGELSAALAFYGAAMRKGLADAVADATKRFVRIVLRTTPPLAGGGKRKEHTDFLRRRILGMRLPRGKLTRGMRQTRHMSKAEARAYFRRAQEMQGALLSGWNAAARVAGLRPAQWIARHGEKYGSAESRLSPSGASTRIRFSDGAKNRRTDIAKFGARALSRVRNDMMKGAQAALARKIKSRPRR